MLVEITKRNFPFSDIVKFATVMDPEAAKTAKESLDLAFHMSNLLNTGLDRHTLSVLIALCDLGLNPEALAAVVKELRSEPVSSSSAPIPYKQTLSTNLNLDARRCNEYEHKYSSFMLPCATMKFLFTDANFVKYTCNGIHCPSSVK
ncbi:hypothetical protein SADUNF_Sadunf06G0023200 [Salix dunnii]|uniref:Uncharacterized protein n=1 Tax=Salix dunnii TaxID=1413687 RepID=A0A835K0U2_9ROSI|nr:hypothetical protein SADUNF_Sadunf06G0023200 [Salix dunnii]